MSAPHNRKIPILTDVMPAEHRDVGPTVAPAEPNVPNMETVIAELQTRLAAETFALADELMQTAFADMEAKIREQISGRLRRELPELIDSLLREYLARDQNR